MVRMLPSFFLPSRIKCQYKVVLIRLFIYTKNTSEPLYEYLKDQLKNQCTLETIINVPSLKDIKKYSQSMIIFDDFINREEGNNIIE